MNAYEHALIKISLASAGWAMEKRAGKNVLKAVSTLKRVALGPKKIPTARAQAIGKIVGRTKAPVIQTAKVRPLKIQAPTPPSIRTPRMRVTLPSTTKNKGWWLKRPGAAKPKTPRV